MKINRMKLERKKKTAAEATADLLDATARELDRQSDVIDALLVQLAEAQLRVRFLMESIYIKVSVPSTIIGGDGRPIGDTVVKTAYEAYVGGERDRFLAALEKRADAEQSLRPVGPAAAGADGPAAEDGEPHRIDDGLTRHDRDLDTARRLERVSG